MNQTAGRTKEINWLRDIMPRLLEQNQQQQIYPRVMTYGYNADVWMTKSTAEIDVPVDNLLSYLATERETVCCPWNKSNRLADLGMAGSGAPTLLYRTQPRRYCDQAGTLFLLVLANFSWF